MTRMIGTTVGELEEHAAERPAREGRGGARLVIILITFQPWGRVASCT